MAYALGGFSSPPTCVASSTRKPTPLVSFSTTISSPAFGGAHLALSPSPSSLRSSTTSPLVVASRKWSLSAVPESLELGEESEPEPIEAQIASAVASETPKGEEVFAVVMIGSRQYIVIPGRYIYTQRLKGANVNDKIVLNKVLLVGTKTNAYIGEPIVSNAVVHAVVEEQGLDRKVIVFKYKKRKHYRRNIGHRQPNTRIRITGITGYQDAPADAIPA